MTGAYAVAAAWCRSTCVSDAMRLDISMNTPREDNPYASPLVEDTLVATSPESTEYERIRRLYINREASIKSIGSLHCLGGAVLLLAGLATFFGYLSRAPLMMLFPAVVCLGLSACSFAVGVSLLRLAYWVRWPAVVLAGLGLLWFPVGTLINGYILYLLLGEKANMVFSPEYREIIRQTPHVKYRTSIVVWILLAILLALIAAVVILNARPIS